MNTQITTLAQAGKYLAEKEVINFGNMTVEGKQLLDVCGYSYINSAGKNNSKTVIERQITKHCFEVEVDYKVYTDVDSDSRVKPMVYEFTMNAAQHVLLSAMTANGKQARQQAIDMSLVQTQKALPTNFVEALELLIDSEKEKEALLIENKEISTVSNKKSLQNYTPTKVLAFLLKEGFVEPKDGLAACDINEALISAGYQDRHTFTRNSQTINSYSLTEKGVDLGVQSTSGITNSCKWVYKITKQADFLEAINEIAEGVFY